MQPIKRACMAIGRTGWWALATCVDMRRQRVAIRHQRLAQLRASTLSRATA
ncbi:MAG TPA: hypothetical protein VFU22_20065 [Roseiflexaceae bacterium]|nr:hypothetical protein [Roseiflexaceae bacterium]